MFRKLVQLFAHHLKAELLSWLEAELAQVVSKSPAADTAPEAAQ